MATEKIKAQINVLEQILLTLRQQLGEAEAAEHRFEWQLLCDRIGILTDSKERNDWHHICYVGFSTKKEAEAMVSRLKKSAQWCANNQKSAPFLAIELRSAKRLLAAKWELKCTDLSISLINKLLVEMAEPEEHAKAI